MTGVEETQKNMVPIFGELTGLVDRQNNTESK